ncbi:hypothetical protein TrVGV298_008244 [Trichoderma virens]|nr:hypothetical protein TrVGV298_008244 [Trichoderma virens]
MPMYSRNYQYTFALRYIIIYTLMRRQAAFDAELRSFSANAALLDASKRLLASIDKPCAYSNMPVSRTLAIRQSLNIFSKYEANPLSQVFGSFKISSSLLEGTNGPIGPNVSLLPHRIVSRLQFSKISGLHVFARH